MVRVAFASRGPVVECYEWCVEWDADCSFGVGELHDYGYECDWFVHVFHDDRRHCKRRWWWRKWRV